MVRIRSKYMIFKCIGLVKLIRERGGSAAELLMALT